MVDGAVAQLVSTVPACESCRRGPGCVQAAAEEEEEEAAACSQCSWRSTASSTEAETQPGLHGAAVILSQVLWSWVESGRSNGRHRLVNTAAKGSLGGGRQTRRKNREMKEKG